MPEPQACIRQWNHESRKSLRDTRSGSMSLNRSVLFILESTPKCSVVNGFTRIVLTRRTGMKPVAVRRSMRQPLSLPGTTGLRIPVYTALALKHPGNRIADVLRQNATIKIGERNLKSILSFSFVFVRVCFRVDSLIMLHWFSEIYVSYMRAA